MPASENDKSSKFLKEITFMPSSIETIDTALYTEIDEKEILKNIEINFG